MIKSFEEIVQKVKELEIQKSENNRAMEILEIQISNSSFDQTIDGAAFIINSNHQTLGILRIANISISSSGSHATGAINITGGFDFLFLAHLPFDNR